MANLGRSWRLCLAPFGVPKVGPGIALLLQLWCKGWPADRGPMSPGIPFEFEFTGGPWFPLKAFWFRPGLGCQGPLHFHSACRALWVLYLQDCRSKRLSLSLSLSLSCLALVHVHACVGSPEIGPKRDGREAATCRRSRAKCVSSPPCHCPIANRPSRS